ncbi:MAG: phosphoribosyl-AMP cyclohydrolase [Desulfurococcales archaeon]|nr:phosphoribosyl-AMP cyclohydrolase [Desulfurococcales archaeon]
MRIEGLERVDFSKGGGLVPVIVVDAATRQILMLGYADREALRRTVETGYAHFYSRSRGRLWMKGESSGNKVRVLKVEYDCDSDAIVYYGVPEGPVCHTGKYTCFHNTLTDDSMKTMWRLIVDAFREAVVYRRKGYGGLDEYRYIVNPLSDNIPPPSPLLQSLIADYLASKIGWGRVDKVVAPEALGLPIASLVAERLGAPLAVVRKRSYPVHGWRAPYASGYEEGVHYIYGVESGERVVFVDDTVSTGGAALSIIGELERHDVNVAAILASMAKPQYGGVRRLEEKGYRVWRAVDVYLDGNKVVRLIQPERGWEAVVEVKEP